MPPVNRKTLILAMSLPIVVAACGDTSPPADSQDQGSIGRQIGQGYLDNLHEAEAASGAASDRARAFEDLDARLRDARQGQ